jgi:hypothetical protein
VPLSVNPQPGETDSFVHFRNSRKLITTLAGNSGELLILSKAMLSNVDVLEKLLILLLHTSGESGRASPGSLFSDKVDKRLEFMLEFWGKIFDLSPLAH